MYMHLNIPEILIRVYLRVYEMYIYRAIAVKWVKHCENGVKPIEHVVDN
jgi:hypothetical protein